MEWYSYLIMVLTILVAFSVAALIWRKGWISTDGLAHLATSIDAVHNELIVDGENLFDQIVGYVATAVHAAEQMCRIGLITMDKRKDTALQLVREYAQLDGIELDEKALNAADSVIESQCDIMGHDDAEDGLCIDDMTDGQLRGFLMQYSEDESEVLACKTRADLDKLFDKWGSKLETE